MSGLESAGVVTITCRATERVGPCFERDCPFDASLLIDATGDTAGGTVFACERHVADGMLRALARFLDAFAWSQSERRPVA